MFRKLMLSVVVAFVAVLVLVIAPVRAEGCELEYIQKEGVNFLSMVLDCPDTEAGYYRFEFGDGDNFDVWFESNGNSAEFIHAYPYVVGGVVTHTASINSDGLNDPDYFFDVVIDDRPDFWVGDVDFRNTLWDWPYEIRRDGVFTFTVNTSCNGLAGNHFGKFQWEIEGPAQGSMFGNWVEEQFVEQALVTTTLVISDVTGIQVWSQEILAPTCSIPKPQIIVGDGPFFTGDAVDVTVVAPLGAESMSLWTDQVFFEYPQPECQPMGGNVPVHAVSCEPGQRVIKMRVGQDSESFLLFARSWFDTPVVESSFEITRVVIPDDIVVYKPTCNLQVTDGSTFNQKIFELFWDNASDPVLLDFGDQATTLFHPIAKVVKVDHDYAWDVTTGSTSYTVTMKVKGTGDQEVACTRQVVITDPNFQPKIELRMFLPRLGAGGR